MRRAPLLALALTCSTAAAAQPAQDPYEAGVAARLAGDPARAVEHLSRVVAADPGNSDAHLQLGLAWLALGRLDEAEAAFRRTLELAPDYHDARLGLARTELRRGDRAAAQAALEGVPPNYEDARELRRQLAEVEGPMVRRWQVSADGSYSFLERDLPDWQELNLELRHQASESTSLAFAAQAARRFERTDVYLEARADLRLSDSAGIHAQAGGTPGADFRPEWQIGLGGDLRVRPGAAATILRLDAAYAEYPAGGIATLTPGIEQYVPGVDGWITVQWFNVFEEDRGHDGGWLGRGDLFVTPGVRLFAGLSGAPDVSLGVAVETFSFFGGAVVETAGGQVLRFSLSHEDRAIGSDRMTIALGLGIPL